MRGRKRKAPTPCNTTLYEVDKLLASRLVNNKVEYKIRWKNNVSGIESIRNQRDTDII